MSVVSESKASGEATMAAVATMEKANRKARPSATALIVHFVRVASIGYFVADS